MKVAKSWKTLELDRELRVLTKWFDGKDWIQVGTCFVVEKPITNQGVMLRRIIEPTFEGGARIQVDKPIKWTRDWKGVFEKVRKVAKRKTKT